LTNTFTQAGGNVSGHRAPLEPLEVDFLEINDLTSKMDPKTSSLGIFDELNEFFDDFLFYYHGFSAFQDNDCYIKIEEMEDFPRRLMRNGGAKLGNDSSILTHSLARSNDLVKMSFFI